MPEKKKDPNPVFEKLGFPEGMTFGHRANLRKECSRFLRFAYLVDFLSLEALANIYTGSVKDMIVRLEAQNANCNMDDVMNGDFSGQTQVTSPARGQEPLFYVQAKLCDDDGRFIRVRIPESEIEYVQIQEFIPPPEGTSKAEDFDPLAHLRLNELKMVNDEHDDEPKEVEVSDDGDIYKLTVPNIQKYWLKMEPAAEDYI